jgi:hypothetical protein
MIWNNIHSWDWNYYTFKISPSWSEKFLPLHKLPTDVTSNVKDGPEDSETENYVYK